MDASERWTVGALVQAAAEVLGKRGIDSARLDADLLLAHVLKLKRLDLYTRFDMPVDEEPRSDFRALIKRRLAREPVAYLLGERDFYESTFFVSPDVLIPRPETELLVDLARAHLKGREGDELRILELGVGSGCLLISLLKLFPKARGLGVDLSPAAIDVALRNGTTHEVTDRMTLREGDWTDAVSEGDFDLVVANPPYIEESEAAELEADVRDYEPGLALFCKEGSLHYHRKTIANADRLLSPDGFMALELGSRGAEGLDDAAAAFSFGLAHDLAGLPRAFVVAREPLSPEVKNHLVGENEASGGHAG